jgi:circadian clock protein KaiB
VKYSLRLYITGSTATSVRAIANLRDICDRTLGGDYEVEVIDVIENPALAEDERILATPMLVRRLPAPVRRIIGDLSDQDRVLLGLDLVHLPQPPAPGETDR